MRFHLAAIGAAVQMGTMLGGAQGVDLPDPEMDIDARHDGHNVEIELEVRQPESETSEQVWVPGERSTEGNPQGGSTGDGSGNGNQAGPGSSHYCLGTVLVTDPHCASMVASIRQNSARLMACETGTVLNVNGGVAPNSICAEDVPPQVTEEALQTALDAGPTWEEILAQIPSEVEQAFSSLPIEGGSVSFEEELQGFGYINRHTNIFVSVESQEFTETLLGIPVEIRVIPSQYRFSYGDGEVRTTYSPGAPAAQSGTSQDQRSLVDAETPTSHIYTQTGIFPVAVTTTFIGEYRLPGGAWTPISGAAAVPASPGEADIWRLDHRHVSGECRDRSHWGCNGPLEIGPGDRPPEIFADQYDESGNYTGP